MTRVNQVPEDLKVLIINTVKAAFSELQNIENLIRITKGFLSEVDYISIQSQRNCFKIKDTAK